MPSDVIGLAGEYERFCFDEACSQFLYYLNEDREPRYKENDKEHTYKRPSDMYKEFSEQFNVTNIKQ